MLTVNHITSLISINWITGSKLYYLNWFFQKKKKTRQWNVNSWIFLHASLKQDWLLTKGEEDGSLWAELILARGRLAQVSVLHKNLYRILKQHPFSETVTIKSWHPPMLLCVCHCRLPTDASQPMTRCNQCGDCIIAHNSCVHQLIESPLPQQWQPRFLAKLNAFNNFLPLLTLLKSTLSEKRHLNGWTWQMAAPQSNQR